MAMSLLIKIKSGVVSWNRINDVVKKYISNQYEFFPIDEKLTTNYKVLGISIPVSASKIEILQLVNDLTILNADITELYNGTKITPENINQLFS